MKVIDLLKEISEGNIKRIPSFKIDNEIWYEDNEDEISGVKAYVNESGYVALDFICRFEMLNKEIEIMEIGEE